MMRLLNSIYPRDSSLVLLARNDILGHVIARSQKRRSNLLVDQSATGFQGSHHMQERRLLRPFRARNDSGREETASRLMALAMTAGGRRLLRPFRARNDSGREETASPFQGSQ
jgi:hypothetical protein